MARDWGAEIDAWTERFLGVPNPPAPFAQAIAAGAWDGNERGRLAEDAARHERTSAALVEEMAGAGVDLVRFDCRQGSCGVCEKYCGKAYSLRGETPGLPPPPPLPICPSCRHTVNLLTPFYLQSLGLEIDDLVDAAQPFVD